MKTKTVQLPGQGDLLVMLAVAAGEPICGTHCAATADVDHLEASGWALHMLTVQTRCTSCGMPVHEMYALIGGEQR